MNCKKTNLLIASFENIWHTFFTHVVASRMETHHGPEMISGCEIASR
jgi:hypothetical protein